MARKRTKAQLRKFRLRILAKARSVAKRNKAKSSFRSVRHKRSKGHYSTTQFKADYKRKSKHRRKIGQPTFRGDLLASRI